MLKKLFSLSLALALCLSLCACASSAPTEIDTTTKFTSEGFTLSVPNEYADLLIVDTTVSAGIDGTFFSVHEKASVEASKALWPDDETMGGGFLFGIGRMDEDGFKNMMCADMSGAQVVARDKDGNYYFRYHPTDVQLIREEYTDADWEQWKELGQWASGAVETFIAENPALTPYTRTSNDIDIVLNRIDHWDEPVTLSSPELDGQFSPTREQSAPYLDQLLDDVLYHSSHASAPEGAYITLTIPSLDWHFDFFTDEGQTQYIRQVFSDGMESLCIASRDGKAFPAGQIVLDWYNATAQTN